MAQRHVVALEDDLDGSEADETVTFALDGTTYEIDLTTAHAEDLREAFAAYIAAGRRTGGRRAATSASTGGGRRTRRTSAAGPTPDEIRAWAQENGYQVSARGRISKSVSEAYEAAH